MQMQMVIPKVCTAILLTFKIYKVQIMHFFPAQVPETGSVSDSLELFLSCVNKKCINLDASV